MEPIELRIRLDTDKGTLKASRALTLGNTYAVTFDGKEGECSLYLLRCRDGKTVAASTTDFMLAVNTQEAIDLFPKDSKCPSETFVHAYVTYDGNVIAAGDVIIRYSPIAFTASGLPVTMQGEQGEKGERGKSVFEEWMEHNPDGTWGQFMQSIKGARGEDGRDAAVIKTSGLYAFSVPDENLLMHVSDLRTFYYTDPLTGDVDTTRPKWAISESGHLLHNVYTDEGKTVVLDLGKVRGETGTGAFEAWLERNPEGSFEEFLETIKGEKGDKGDPGAPGMSEESVREIVEGYSYAKATDLLAYVKAADAAKKYALADALAKVAKNLEGKQDALTFDDKTVPESKNPVTSGGLHSQFQQVEAWIADLVARIDSCYARVTSVMAFRGVVHTVDDLPEAGANLTGDVWTVSESGAEYVWDGSKWEYLGRVIDLSAYATKEELEWLKQAAEINGQHISSVTAIVNELVGKSDTFEEHIADKSNPHKVTAEQVGAVSTKDGGKVEGTVSYAPYAPEGAISTAYDGEILATGNVIHLTTPDSSEGPCAWASGLVSGITANSVCPLTVVIENKGTEAQNFTLMNDDLVTFKFSSGGEGYVPCSELAPGAFCFVNLLVWKRSPKPLVFVRGYYRTDKVNYAGMMSPVLFSYGGKAYRLEVDENGGLSTNLAG